MRDSLAAVFEGPEKSLQLRKLPCPNPQGEEILVRVAGCTLCGSDLHSYTGRRETPTPTILGHEIVGDIVAFGDASDRRDLAGNRVKQGDRVTWTVVASCGSCFYCQRNLPQKCLKSTKYGHEPLGEEEALLGGLSEYCLLKPGAALVKIPRDLPLAVACPASCATSTAAATIEAAGELRDRNVCVFGAGLLGLTTLAMLRIAGAADIVCVDLEESRLARAEEFGASRAIHPSELESRKESVPEHGFDVVLEISGASEAFEAGWQTARVGGTIVLVGSVFPAPAVPIQLDQIVRRNLTICGVHNYRPDHLATAIEFLSQYHQRFPFEALVSKWLPLESAEEGFALSRDPKNVRVGVRPE